MIYSWQTEQWLTVDRLINTQRLPHALLLQGTKGVGKTAFALELAAKVLCKQNNDSERPCGACEACHLLNAGTHPDLTYIQPAAPENSKSAKPVLSIRIDTIRNLCNKLSKTSQFSGYRVVILENADRMVIAAANALLKSLEEPGDQTLIILTSSRPQRLPITIRSRCQSIKFPVPNSASAEKWLSEQGVDNAHPLLKMAHGAPLLAASFAEEHQTQAEVLTEALFASSKGGQAVTYANELSSIHKETALSWFLDWLTDLKRVQQGLPKECITNEKYYADLQKRAENISEQRLYQLYDLTTRYIRSEGIALNPQLLWENLLLSWDSI